MQNKSNYTRRSNFKPSHSDELPTGVVVIVWTFIILTLGCFAAYIIIKVNSDPAKSFVANDKMSKEVTSLIYRRSPHEESNNAGRVYLKDIKRANYKCSERFLASYVEGEVITIQGMRYEVRTDMDCDSSWEFSTAAIQIDTSNSGLTEKSWTFLADPSEFKKKFSYSMPSDVVDKLEGMVNLINEKADIAESWKDE
ncbi:hypothetical protein ACI2KR_09265 [Pseudomonas luteola]